MKSDLSRELAEIRSFDRDDAPPVWKQCSCCQGARATQWVYRNNRRFPHCNACALRAAKPGFNSK